jgi:hypothetical protein
MYRNQRSPEHVGEMCLVFEKFICGFQMRNCRLRQVAEKREGFVTATRVRRRFDLVQALHELRGTESLGQVSFGYLFV